MYRVRACDYSKRDPVKRWALPDRVFFACGACHILAYAVLQRYRAPDRGALWIRSRSGRHGHIVVADKRWVFDYHGCHDRGRYLAHTFAKARRWWPEWNAHLVELPTEVRISEPLSRSYEGLRLREPGQFLHDALPRAFGFLDRMSGVGRGSCLLDHGRPPVV